MSSLNYPPVARMNATRTTPPYHPIQAEEEQKSTTNPSKLTACEITVARPAPAIPKSKTATNNKSNTILEQIPRVEECYLRSL